jgi:hypothetical protein
MLAFLVITALFVATVLLWLSMRKQLGRIRVDGADGGPVEGPSDGADGAVDGAGDRGGDGPSGEPGSGPTTPGGRDARS